MNIEKHKWSWIAQERVDGWRVALVVGNKRYPIRGLTLASQKDCKKIVGVGKTVFVHRAKCVGKCSYDMTRMP
jgi:hypothetical protein